MEHGTPTTPGVVFGRRLAAERRRQGLTQQDLAQRCSDLGADFKRTTITKIEGGGTRASNVSLEDVFILAAALDTSPAVLFLPIGIEDEIDVTPNHPVHPHLVMKWIEGVAPLQNRRISNWRESIEPLRLYRGLRPLQDRVHRTRHQLKSAEYVGDGNRVVEARSDYVDALREITEYMETMERRGVRPVELHQDVQEEMRAAGVEPWTENHE